MSKITNDSLTRCGTGCFIASCTLMATVGVEGINGTNPPLYSPVDCVCEGDVNPEGRQQGENPGAYSG